ncbi:hypothetical protein EDB80DRAFT_18830 [Ilyonectria destructans]|nr:hypothetical protein EDB80DRAFT_18830 [Ilyonectria destructans]
MIRTTNFLCHICGLIRLSFSLKWPYIYPGWGFSMQTIATSRRHGHRQRSSTRASTRAPTSPTHPKSRTHTPRGLLLRGNEPPQSHRYDDHHPPASIILVCVP